MPFAGHPNVGTAFVLAHQDVERIFDLAGCPRYWQRNDGKQPKPPRVLEREIGGIVVAIPRRAARGLGIAEAYARECQRKDAGRHALGVPGREEYDLVACMDLP